MEPKRHFWIYFMLQDKWLPTWQVHANICIRNYFFVWWMSSPTHTRKHTQRQQTNYRQFTMKDFAGPAILMVESSKRTTQCQHHLPCQQHYGYVLRSCSGLAASNPKSQLRLHPCAKPCRKHQLPASCSLTTQHNHKSAGARIETHNIRKWIIELCWNFYFVRCVHTVLGNGS